MLKNFFKKVWIFTQFSEKNADLVSRSEICFSGLDFSSRVRSQSRVSVDSDYRASLKY
ncbi:unnamed protein product [Meloidogyne enterolobii]|uniref:Uncharacterized protein n=1 Tax=Meloidogyne enterolobii TaxID=390850 RepID=A0ACB1B0K5_MELEN